MTQLPTMEKQFPKTKKVVDMPLPIPSDAETEVSELEMEYQHYFAMADEMLHSIVRENRQPSFAEQTFFKGRCAWGEREAQLQVSRMASISRYKAVAGTSSERQAAESEQVRSASILEFEGAKIQTEIGKLQEQFDALERNATRAERVVAQITDAVESLRSVDILRSDLKAAYDGKRREFAERDWNRLGEVGVEIQFREQLLSPIEDDRKFIEALGIHFPDCLKYSSAHLQFEIVNEVWEARKKTMRMELMELRDEHDRLTAAKARQMAILEPMLNHYLEEK